MVSHKLFDEASGVTTADNGRSIVFFADHFGGDSGSGGVGGIFGFAKQAVPNDGAGVGDEIGEFCSREGANV